MAWFAKVEKTIESRKLWPLAFGWGFAEALSWPIIAEAFLAFFVVVKPKKVLPAAAVLALGSATGTVVHAYAGTKGYDFPRPLTTHKMHTTAEAQVKEEGPRAVRHQLFSGVPVKVYGHAMGTIFARRGQEQKMSKIFIQTLLWRGLRIMGVAAVIAGLSRRGQAFVQRFYMPLTTAGAAVLAFTLHKLVKKWQ